MPLNFAPGRNPLWHRLALAGAVVAIVSVGVHITELNERLRGIQDRENGIGTALMRPPGTPPAAVGPGFSARMAAAQSVVRRIALPWDRLFEALGSAAGQDVSLLNLQPHSSDGTLLLTAEAKDLTAMLTYMGRLQAAAGIVDVLPQHHESVPGESQYAVRFTLTAKWKAEP